MQLDVTVPSELSRRLAVSIHRTALDVLTWEEIVEFCDQQVAENTVLDYKRDMPADIEKTVAAMANTVGGLILVGVAENDHAKPALPLPGIATKRGLVEQVMSRAFDHDVSIAQLDAYASRYFPSSDLKEVE
jgi:hypothetical protein